jgi:hypothetical protein
LEECIWIGGDSVPWEECNKLIIIITGAFCVPLRHFNRTPYIWTHTWIYTMPRAFCEWRIRSQKLVQNHPGWHSSVKWPESPQRHQ